jgi:transcriptional regulator with XRE-family HTH domain
LLLQGRYVKYEDGTSEAPYEILKKIAQYYQVSIDLLLSVDIRKVEVSDLLKLENNRLPFHSNGRKLKLLPKSKKGLLKRLCRSGIY